MQTVRDDVRDEPREGGEKTGSDRGSTRPVTPVGVRLKRYAMRGFGLLLVAAMVTFVAQNADPIRVRFLAWETHLSQALVLLLTLLSGVILGVVSHSWRRWRSSRASRR